MRRVRRGEFTFENRLTGNLDDDGHFAAAAVARHQDRTEHARAAAFRRQSVASRRLRVYPERRKEAVLGPPQIDRPWRRPWRRRWRQRPKHLGTCALKIRQPRNSAIAAYQIADVGPRQRDLFQNRMLQYDAAVLEAQSSPKNAAVLK